MQITYSHISSRTLTRSHKKWSTFSTIRETRLNYPKQYSRDHMIKFMENPVLHAGKPYGSCSAVATAGKNGSRLLWIRERPTQRICIYNPGYFDFEASSMLNKTHLHEVRYDFTKKSTHLQKRHFISATKEQNTTKIGLVQDRTKMLTQNTRQTMEGGKSKVEWKKRKII